jgi:uncharacterized protein with PIN domain
VDIQNILDAIRHNPYALPIMPMKKRKMKPFEKCPMCGGELVEKEVEKLLRGTSNETR